MACCVVINSDIFYIKHYQVTLKLAETCFVDNRLFHENTEFVLLLEII